MLAGHPEISVIGESVNLDNINETETEVVLLASASSASLLDGKRDYAILFLTEDVESVRPFLNSKVRTWGLLSTDTTEDESAAAIHADGQDFGLAHRSWSRDSAFSKRGIFREESD